jgi:flagellar biosynthesis protein FlhF
VVETATVPLLVDSGPWTGEGDARDDLFRVLASRPGVRTHLVVAAETPPETLRRVCDRLAGIRPCRAVITKVDEAESLLGLLAALRDRRLLVSYLGTGPRVPEDLRIASPAVLASWVRGGHRAGADA